jgi:hypothetical protein
VDVNELNLKIQHLLPGDLVSYKSIDTICDATEAVNYTTEFLNSLDLPGVQPHNLQLKVGFPVILLRNLNPPRLCNVHTNNYTWHALEPSSLFVLVKDRITKNKYCTLGCIKGLIFFFNNIVIIIDIYF